jgi:hypothetical protein
MTKTNTLEDLFLNIFKFFIMLMMGVAILAVPLMLVGAAYMAFQEPARPPAVHDILLKNLSVEQLKLDLLEAEKTKKPPVDNQSPNTTSRSFLKYSEQAIALLRCANSFSIAAGVEIAQSTNAQSARELEDLRSALDRLASPESRGLKFVDSLVTFGCQVLKDPNIVALKKSGEIGSVIGPTVKFFDRAWDNAEDARNQTIERESVRVIEAKAFAVSLVIGAGALFVVFLILAIYLIIARIELHMKNISFRHLGN